MADAAVGTFYDPSKPLSKCNMPELAVTISFRSCGQDARVVITPEATTGAKPLLKLRMSLGGQSQEVVIACGWNKEWPLSMDWPNDAAVAPLTRFLEMFPMSGADDSRAFEVSRPWSRDGANVTATHTIKQLAQHMVSREYIYGDDEVEDKWAHMLLSYRELVKFFIEVPLSVAVQPLVERSIVLGYLFEDNGFIKSCPITLEQLGEDCVHLPCHHFVSGKAFDKWERAQPDATTCPLCRARVRGGAHFVWCS